MKLIRTCFVLLAVLIPTSWTLAHAGDDMKDGTMKDEKGGEMKKDKKMKKPKKDSGDMGDMKKGDMDKK